MSSQAAAEEFVPQDEELSAVGFSQLEVVSQPPEEEAEEKITTLEALGLHTLAGFIKSSRQASGEYT